MMGYANIIDNTEICILYIEINVCLVSNDVRVYNIMHADTYQYMSSAKSVVYLQNLLHYTITIDKYLSRENPFQSVFRLRHSFYLHEVRLSSKI